MRLKDIVYHIGESNSDFISNLRKMMKDEGLTINELSQAANIPKSTLYKIMSDPEKDFRISTFRMIINGMEKILGFKDKKEENIIAVITSKEALDSMETFIDIEGKTIKVKEFSALTIEDEIIQGINAERMGAKGILCGPVAANTLEKVVRIPVMSLRFESDTIIKGLKKLTYKF